MPIYTLIKSILVKTILDWKIKLTRFNLTINARNEIKTKIRKNKIKKLNKLEIKEAKAYYKSKGYKLKNTYWHQYYKGMTGKFYKNYFPEDIFRPIVSPKFNQMLQWPALLDKNLYYKLFNGFEQPKAVVFNINGFYFINNEHVTESKAIQACINAKSKLIIKPTIDSGKGEMVKSFSTADVVEIDNTKFLTALFKTYKKDFIVQEFLKQSSIMEQLNPSTVNTLRVMSYLRNNEVHIISALVRIGKKGTDTDNYSAGGIICGIYEDGEFKDIGYSKHYGDIYTETESGIPLKGCKVPNYNEVKIMIKNLHKVVPYFRIISWDIAINHKEKPVLIEYNTYYQSTEVHQIVNGPLFDKFADELLARGLE